MRWPGLRSTPPSTRSQLRLALWIAATALVTLLAFGATFYLSARSASRSNEVEVPDLQGLDLEEAQLRVAPVQLVLEVAEQRNDPVVESGRVLEQTPRAGNRVRRGRKVRLVLSLGDRVLEVPNLVGRASRTVEIDLRREGFGAGEVARVPSFDSAAGVVIAQVPAPATPAVPHARVHRLVSDGAPVAVWVMPDLSGLERDDAERWISRSGFRRGAVRRVRMGGRTPDTVIGQLPLAGYPVRTRDVVELTVAQ